MLSRVCDFILGYSFIVFVLFALADFCNSIDNNPNNYIIATFWSIIFLIILLKFNKQIRKERK